MSRKTHKAGGRNAPPLSWGPMLACTPVRSPAAEPQPDTPTGMLVLVRGDKPRYLVPPLSWIIRPRLHRRVWLDRIGTDIWALCDGTRSVEAIVDAFAETNRLTFHESRVAVTSYLKELMTRGVIAMSVPAPSPSD